MGLSDETLVNDFFGTINYGEPNTLWQIALIGHEFKFYDSITNDLLFNYKIEYNTFNIIGDGNNSTPKNIPNENIIRSDTKDIMIDTVSNSKRIKQHFTPLGFTKGKLPKHLYNSMHTFYYNNRNHLAYENWTESDRHINWWKTPSYMIVAPWKLKGMWQDELKDLVELWIGNNIKLETTDIYGMREYRHGARLLSHVDREETHAVSLIINVAQNNIIEEVQKLLNDNSEYQKMSKAHNPYGNGNASEKILNTLKD